MVIQASFSLEEQVTECPYSSSTSSKSSFFCAHQRIYIALYDKSQAERIAKHALHVNYVIVSDNSDLREKQDFDGEEQDNFLCSLVDVYQFDKMANQTARRNADHKLVFPAGCDARHQLKVVFLIGCHMVLSHGLNEDQTFKVLKRFNELLPAMATVQSMLWTAGAPCIAEPLYPG